MVNRRRTQVGVIGAGGISQLCHIPNLVNEARTDLVAVCDTDISRATSVTKRFGIPHWFDEPELMFNRLDLDCVVLTTPTITHLPLCQLAMESGVDVMVEKPFAINIDEARRIVEIAEKTGQILMVGMNHRFREDVAHLKRSLEKNQLGELFMVRSGWLKRLGVWGRPYWFTDPKLAGGGVLMDLGLQMIDMVLFLLDFPAIVEVSCGIGNHVLGLEVEDTATAFIRFEDGVTFQLAVSWAICHDQDIAYTYFDGSHGGASLNPFNINRRQKDRIVPESIPQLVDEAQLYRRSFQSEISHFIACVKSRTQPVSSGYEALAAIEAVSKLYRISGN